jgi:alanyl-tRNA synthetase
MPITERLYYEYNSALPFNASIMELRPHGEGKTAVILDKTIFYPEGGGQPGDRGTINGRPLLDVTEQDGEILHLINAGAPKEAEGTASAAGAGLALGPAALVLDAARRRDLTVQHSSQHLLSGTILRLTGRPTVSMHLGDEICTIDVDKGLQSPRAELTCETILAIEETAADAIEGNHPLIIHLCPPEDVSSFPLRKGAPKGEELIRVVEIEGNDFSPCCGTHLKSTGEIGILRILGAEKYKGMTRVSFIAGRRCLRESRLLHRNGNIVSRALSVPLADTGKGVLDLLEKTAALERRLKALEEAAARIKAEELIKKAGLEGAGSGGVIIEAYPGEGIDEVLLIGRAAQKLSSAVLVLASEKDFKFAAFCALKGFDLRPLVKDAFEKSGGRGGGGPAFFQGSFTTAGGLAEFLAAVRALQSVRALQNEKAARA